MDFLPLWIWPLIVCGLAVALRLALPGSVRKLQGDTRHRAVVSASVNAMPVVGWLRRTLSGRAAATEDEPVAILGRKVVGPQQSILLVRIWDEEIAVCLQPGSPATVLTHRKKTTEAADHLLADSATSEARSFRSVLERQCT